MIALEFIKRIESGDIIEKDELLILLSKLEGEAESLPDRFDTREYLEFDGIEYETRWQMAARVCPYLGLFEDGEYYLDGVDDVADIYGDLKQVEWSLNNTSDDDAIWHYKFLYTHHFKDHIADLKKQITT